MPMVAAISSRGRQRFSGPKASSCLIWGRKSCVSGSWKTMPARVAIWGRLRERVFSPRRKTSPSIWAWTLWGIIPLKARQRVLFPQPLGPATPSISPCRRLKLRWRYSHSPPG